MSRHECRIAGVRLTTNREVAGDDGGPCSTASSEVLFLDAPADPPSDWLRIPNPGTGADVRIRRDGRQAVITADPAGPDQGAREMRWATPFIAALQGETVLHASAVERGGCVYAFVAGSRTGKSTFSNALATRGWNKVADDLLPQCFFEQSNRRLRALFLLERPRGGGAIGTRRLSVEEALGELVVNGFDELAEAAIWETHFRFYCRIVEAVPCRAFTIPDDMSRVGEAAAWWERMLEAEAWL
ncbi:MAG: hypothetical protein ABSH46_05215 [Bryobacteraceae bacterium]|jgi:hypothetical protein